MGDPFGTPWGALGDALEDPRGALEGLGDALGALGDALVDLLGRTFLGEPSGIPWKTYLEGPTRELRRGPAKALNPIILWMYVCTYVRSYVTYVRT